MKTAARILIILIFAFATPICMMAEKVNISGTVTDNEGAPVEFASVQVAGTAIGTSTDLKGNYRLSVVQKDTIEIKFSCIGFRTYSKKLIDAKGDVTLNVKLPPADYMLDNVEITAYKNNPQGMQNLDVESFKLSPDVSGGSVEAMLTTMAGVNSSNEMSSQYSVRGGSFDENSVTINGIDVYRPQLLQNGQQEGLSIINPDLVGGVSFSTGGFAARYDDKMSSVLDITYREPEPFEASLSGSLMGGSLSLGVNTRKFSMIHGLRLKKNNSLLSSLDTKGQYDPLYFDYQTNITLKPNDRWTVNLLGNISINDYKFTPSDRETSFGTSEDVKHFKVYFDGAEHDKFETYLGALTIGYRRNRATAFELSLSGFMTNELVSYDISGEYWLDMAGTSGDGALGGEAGVGKYMEHSRTRLKASVLQAALKGITGISAHSLNYGLIFKHENFHDRTREWEWRDSAGYSLPTLPEGVHLIYNLSSRHNLTSNRLAFYLEDTYSWYSQNATVTINGGVRCSYWDFNKEFLVSPRLGVNITPKMHPAWRFRFTTGMYYQQPFFKEYRRAVEDEVGNAIIELNNHIKSPLSVQLIFGTDYTFRALGRPFKVTMEAYYKNLSRLITYESDNLKVTYTGENDSKGNILGVDFRLFGQFVEGTDSWLSFSLMSAKQKINGVTVPMPSEQRYSFALYFTDYFPKFPKLKFSLRGIFSDGLTMTPPRVTRDVTWFRAPAYKRVDIGVSYQFIGAPDSDGTPKKKGVIKNLTLGADVFNLFGISNVSSYYWVTDVNDIQYAVPNYLTGRRFNVRLTIGF